MIKASALLEELSSDEHGNIHGSAFMDDLLPTEMETPAWETCRVVTRSRRHSFGANGVDESATVGAPPTSAILVVDALACRGVCHIDMLTTPRTGHLLVVEHYAAE